MNAARKVRALPWAIDAALFRLAPPIELPTGERVEHVVVSIGPLTNGDHGTLIVAADENGEVTSWAPLANVQANTHPEALTQLGYEVQA